MKKYVIRQNTELTLLNDYRETTWNDVKDSSYPFFQITPRFTVPNEFLIGRYNFDEKQFYNKGTTGMEIGTIIPEDELLTFMDTPKYGMFFYFTDELNADKSNPVWCTEIHISNLNFNDAAKGKYLFTSNAELPLY